MNRFSLLYSFLICSFLMLSACKNQHKIEKPKISFSFDDGATQNFPGYKNADWNQLLIDKLTAENVQTILFVKGKNLDNEAGRTIIKSWNDAGHLIANHTYSHPYFNSKKVSLNRFKQELVKNDSLINNYSNFTKLFRFPYLKEGNTIEKRDGFRVFLKEKEYKIGHVTVDASDWYINQRLVKRLKENPQSDISGYRNYYLKHLYNRAEYYNSLGKKLTGRQIHHNILLHHNLTSALFIDDLIKHFKKNGWEIVNAEKAYKDPIYTKTPVTIPAGESLLWALAKQTKKYDSILRYPAEDSRYEKEAMDFLGL